jgi:hypothetical protein
LIKSDILLLAFPGVFFTVFFNVLIGGTLAVPVAGPEHCSPSSGSEGSPGGYSKFSCCRTVTDGSTTYTECRTCETKNDKLECGEYQRSDAKIGGDAGVYEEPKNNLKDKSTIGNNTGTLVKPSTEKKSFVTDSKSETLNDLSLATDKELKRTIQCQPSVICYGTNNIDIMEGTRGDDDIYGLDGNDVISGLGSISLQRGYDVINGGDGEDTINGSPDFDILVGMGGNDKIYGKGGNDGLFGHEGNDYIEGSDGNDRMVGGEGQDILIGGNGDDKIYQGNADPNGPPSFDYSSPDGHKDKIDCGWGQDEVWLNTGSDGDISVNCEKIHSFHPSINPDTGNLNDKLVQK